MTFVFVNITPEMREQIQERIRQTIERVLNEAVNARLLTPAQADAEAQCILTEDVPTQPKEVKLQ